MMPGVVDPRITNTLAKLPTEDERIALLSAVLDITSNAQQQRLIADMKREMEERKSDASDRTHSSPDVEEFGSARGSSAAVPHTVTTIRDAIEAGITTKVITLADSAEYSEFRDMLESLQEIYSLADNTPPGLLFSLAFNDSKNEITIRDLPSIAPGTGIKQCLDGIVSNFDIGSYLAAP